MLLVESDFVNDTRRRYGVISVLSCALIALGTGAQSPSWPGARARHHLVYDAAATQVLLVGGSNDGFLWTWDGRAWQSQSSTLAARANDATAFDPVRGRLIVHGGSDAPDETWEWDRRSWQRVSSGGPGIRGHHAMTYDPVHKQVLLFGNNDDIRVSDTWGWDGRSWNKLADEGPPPRGVHGQAFDEKRGVLVIFGGCCASGVRGDTWEWNGRLWSQIATPVSPSPRYDTSMAYDPTRGRVVLFGGWDRTTSFSDTWEYDGRAWTRLEVAGPPPRGSHAMVYDPRAKAILLFGGRSGRTQFNDFWAFDGTWKQIAPTPSR